MTNRAKQNTSLTEAVDPGIPVPHVIDRRSGRSVWGEDFAVCRRITVQAHQEDILEFDAGNVGVRGGVGHTLEEVGEKKERGRGGILLVEGLEGRDMVDKVLLEVAGMDRVHDEVVVYPDQVVKGVGVE